MNTRWPCMAGTPVLALLLAACGAMATDSDAPGLDGTAWVLSTLTGRTLDGTTAATLDFADGRIAGSDGCNRYSGPYSAQGGRIEVSSQLAATQMACAPAVMEQARAYLAALGAARSYRIDGGRLELLAADGAVLATFASQSQTLAGTSWRATGINNGRQAVTSLAPDTQVTMSFGTDGRASGSSGCNRYTAGYAQDGAALKFSQAVGTRMMCAQPGVMEQEQRFLVALGAVAGARIEGNRLELRTAAGALAASFVRAD